MSSNVKGVRNVYLSIFFQPVFIGLLTYLLLFLIGRDFPKKSLEEMIYQIVNVNLHLAMNYVMWNIHLDSEF